MYMICIDMYDVRYLYIIYYMYMICIICTMTIDGADYVPHNTKLGATNPPLLAES